jgi:hypothetical protein
LQRPLEFTRYVSIKYAERLAEAGIESSVGSVGNIPPAEAKERYYAKLEQPVMARDSNRPASGKPGAMQSTCRAFGGLVRHIPHQPTTAL